MAYLTEHLSRQDLNLLPSKLDKNTDKPSSSTNASLIGNEHGNFDIARRLSEEKHNLIDGLAEFPIAALIILNNREKNAGTETDEEASLASDVSSALGEIRKHYQNAVNHCGKCLEAEFKEELVKALKAFPYTFDDLGKIIDFLIYAYQIRGLAPADGNDEEKKARELLVKRQQAKKHRQAAQFGKLSGLLQTIDIYTYDADFLFLSESEMSSKVSALILIEHRWLSARQQLAEANNKLVLFIANQYKSGFLDFEDLVQEGQTGLLKAVDRFDYRLGFQFSTYAGYWIRQAISRALSRCERLVRVPCGQVANINKVFRAKNELTSRTGMEPSVKELADYTKLTVEDINMIMSISQTSLPLEGPEDDEEAFAPIDYLEQQVFTHAFNSIAEADLGHLLNNAIGSLNAREAKVICSHFGVDQDKEQTLQEIGLELNLTRERVRQIQVIALNKMRSNFGGQLSCFLQ